MDATLLLKATIVLAAALAAARLLARAPAAARHRYWSVLFALLLVLPLLGATLPQWDVPVPAVWQPEGPSAVEPSRPVRIEPVAPVDDPAAGAQAPVADGVPPTGDSAARVSPSLTVRMVLVSVWTIGTAVATLALLLSLWRVRRLSTTSAELRDPEWTEVAAGIAARLGMTRPVRLLLNDAVTTPMAGGTSRPTVFLPASAETWTEEQRDVVLAHEISHLASRDGLRHLLARVAVAAYWFHPLAWLAAREAGTAREEACDAAVLALGTRPSVYARVLLDLAESTSRPRLIAALPMVQRSHLETRLMAILNAPHSSARRFAVVPMLMVGAFTIAVAAAHPGLPLPGAAVETPAITTAVTAIVPAPAAVSFQSSRASECWSSAGDGSFNGSTSTSQIGGRTIIHEQIGSRGTTRIIQKALGDVRVCLVAENVGDWRNPETPTRWLGVASRYVMEARRDPSTGSGQAVQQLEGVREAGGSYKVTWRVGGRDRALDAAAEQWRDRMLAVLDTTWELSRLRGEVSSLRGEISSVRGEQSSLRGEISSMRGHVSSLRGQISSVRGEESSLRGRISSIRGHVSSLRGAISSERGAISSLNAGRYGSTPSERSDLARMIARHEEAIDRIEKEIRDYNADAKVAAVEREIAALDVNSKVAAIEAEIRAYDVDSKVADVERRIAALDVEGKVAAIERKIGALDADRRGRDLENRRDSELKRLEAAITAIR